MDTVALALRLWIVLVLLAAVAGKLRGRTAWRQFRDMLSAVGVPGRWVTATGVTVTGVEALCVVVGPWPVTGAAGLAVATALFVAFTAGVAIAVRRGVAAACRCFGASGGQLRRLHIVRNAALTVVAAAAAVTSAIAPRHGVDLPALALCLVTAAVAAMVVVRLEDLADLLGPAPAGLSPAASASPDRDRGRAERPG